MSWRRLLLRNGPAFLDWLELNGRFARRFDSLADRLESFLLGRLTSAEAARLFVRALPLVLDRCDDRATYELEFSAEAFAEVHLLERYRRAWRVFEVLVRTGVLPLGSNGVRILDVGAGPAPTSWAARDFYAELAEFGNESGIEALDLPGAEVESAEASVAMIRFVHHFAEFTGSCGPFVPSFTEFAEIDAAGDRQRLRKSSIERIERELDTSEDFARWLFENEGPRLDGLYRYRLCLFSNFFTTVAFVEESSERLRQVLSEVTSPGSVAIFLGGIGREYPLIYDRLSEVALEAGLKPVDNMPHEIDVRYDDAGGARIKQLYDSVWTRISELNAADTGALMSARDLWDPSVPYRSSRAFGVRAFRRAQWRGGR